MTERFQPTLPQSASRVSSARLFAPGVFCLDLKGKIGSDQKISLRSVRGALAGRRFDHLHIRINSSGGDVSEGQAIFEYLRSQPVPISSEVVDNCLSMALVLLMAGDLRFTTGDCDILDHSVSSHRNSLPETINPDILRAHAEQLDETNERIAHIFAARTGHPVAWFQEEAKSEDNMGIIDAIQSGVLHEVSGLTQHITPAWPAILKALPDNIYIPAHQRTANYLAACRCAASLYGEGL
jgi:ATP-dependent protease ClpP protease subunit